MSRPLRLVADEPRTVLSALRDALAGGDAILPVPNAARPATARPYAARPERAGRGDIPAEVGSKVALVVQTSGSTGEPKRVALSAEALLAGARASEAALGGPGQWLLALPAHYIAGLNVLTRSIAAGTDPVLLGGELGDPARFAAAASALDHPVRFTALVPAQLEKLIASPPALEALTRFDRILVGGQAMPAGLLDRVREHGLRVTRTYGSSETSGGCVYDGVPIGGAAVRVADGEVQLGGPMLAEGYLNDPEATERAFFADEHGRWYRTSDSGMITDGVLRVTGRLDDVIISGGIKVALSAIERVVTALPGLGGAVVGRRPDARWGEVPVVYSTIEADVASMRAAVESELGAAARPSALVVVEAIPRLPSGKPDRRRLDRCGLEGR